MGEAKYIPGGGKTGPNDNAGTSALATAWQSGTIFVGHWAREDSMAQPLVTEKTRPPASLGYVLSAWSQSGCPSGPMVP